MTSAAAMPSGFSDKSLSVQSTFRAVMNAMARPGRMQRVGAWTGCPAPLMRGTAAIALTLFDQDTPVWLDETISTTPQVADWIKFHTGAPVVADASACSFALVADAGALPDFGQFAWGTGEYPDRSTTIIAQASSFETGRTFKLRGPGIDGFATLNLPIDLIDRLAPNAARFPCGIDLILVADDAVVAIPRTTRLFAEGS